MISYNVDGVSMPQIKRRLTTAWIRQVAQKMGYKVGEVAYIFCSNEKILEVNRAYLQHDYFTDIITFDYTEGRVISGDIFISLETVAQNAAEFSQSYEDELDRVIIHGILHLCGQNDKSPEDNKRMHELEDEALLERFFKRIKDKG